MKLFQPYTTDKLNLNSRIIMAPLTRSRAIDNNMPNNLMAAHYEQRAGAGLIIAEGTAPSPNGLGYRNIPGLFSKEQVEKWKLSTDKVKNKNGIFFVQLMHTGRVGHTNNLPKGARLLAPSAIAQPGEVSTYDLGKQPYSTPIEMNADDIESTIKEFVNSSELAIKAGFDGVEIHCAHGYLPNQFINTSSNTRTDAYGGSIENRCKFVLEILKQTIDSIGSDKVGIRISPHSYAEVNEEEQLVHDTYLYLTDELNKLNLAYLHLSHMGDPTPLKFELFKDIRGIYNGTLMICGDFTKETAEQAIQNNECDLVAFGRDYIANPDLVERFKNDWPLAKRDNKEWYGDGASGYTDYPNYK